MKGLVLGFVVLCAVSSFLVWLFFPLFFFLLVFDDSNTKKLDTTINVILLLSFTLFLPFCRAR